MLDLAFQCKNLVSLAHVSTAFVDGNSPNGSYFTETIREMQGEVEQVMADCLKMDPVQCEKNLHSLIQGHNDTYTFTKSCAEHYLGRNRKNLRIAILRPSIIIHSCKEPVIGWSDTAAAAGAIALQIILGTQNTVRLSDAIFDLIPGDIVSNSILVSAAYAAWTPEPQLTLFNCTSSTVSPCNARKFFQEGTEKFVKFYPYENRSNAPVALAYYDNKKVYDAAKFIEVEAKI